MHKYICSILLLVCAYMNLCVYMLYVWGPKVNIGYLPQWLLHIYLFLICLILFEGGEMA